MSWDLLPARFLDSNHTEGERLRAQLFSVIAEQSAVICGGHALQQVSLIFFPAVKLAISLVFILPLHIY